MALGSNAAQAGGLYGKPGDAEDAYPRVRSLGIFIGILFLVLLARFWFLQIAEHEKFEQQSEANRIASIELPAPRGIIRDRNGVILATTRPAFSVRIMPAEVVDEDALMTRLSQILGQPKEELQQGYKANQVGRFAPVVIARDIPMTAVTSLMEEEPYLPGVSVASDPVRVYPKQIFASHLLGYVREISASEIKRLNDPSYLKDLPKHLGAKMTPAELRRLQTDLYRPRDIVGKMGVEKLADRFLRGQSGKERVARDARGNILSVLDRIQPVPGDTVNLTLDARVQRAAEDKLKGLTGSAVAIDPRNGDILAMASSPAFDPAWFTQRMSPEEYKQKLGQSQLNRAMTSAYPPGSTFKIVTATALLQDGTINTHTTAYCTGSMRIGNMTKRCWAVHGSVNIYSALAKSCDIFFYTWSGLNLLLKSPDPLSDWGERFGLGRRTGIPINGEVSGYLPRLVSKRTHKRRQWYPGDAANISIGQGDVLLTPLQDARMISVIANGGIVYQPRVIRDVTGLDGKPLATFPPVVQSRANIRPDVLKTVQQGLRMAVTDGTARICNLPTVAVAGKTGSAEAGRTQAAHAWFCCYAPYENPTIAIAVMVEHGRHGASAAAPIAKQMIEAYFGIQSDPSATPAVRGD